MKKTVFSIVSVLLLHAVAHAQTPAVQKLSGDLQKDLIVLLKPGVHVADILGKKQPTAREYQLLAKVTKAALKNQAWFMDTLPKLPPDEQVPALEKTGLTKEELDEYTALSKKSDELVAYTKDTLLITRSGNIISFKGQNHLRPLDSVRIDIAGKQVLYRGYRLSYEGMADTGRRADHPGITISAGYRFGYAEDPVITGDTNLSDFRRVNMASMQLSIGQEAGSGKTLLFFMAMKYEAGKVILGATVPVLFE